MVAVEKRWMKRVSSSRLMKWEVMRITERVCALEGLARRE